MRARLVEKILLPVSQMVRKDFTPSEGVAIADAITAEIGNRIGTNQYSEGRQNFAKPAKEIAAERASFGNPETYRQAKAVVTSGVPELVQAMVMQPDMGYILYRDRNNGWGLRDRNKENPRMTPNLKAALVGAIIAVIVGFAVSQGLISQQTAEEIKAKTNEVLAEQPETTPQQPIPAPTEASQPQSQPQQNQAQ